MTMAAGLSASMLLSLQQHRRGSWAVRELKVGNKVIVVTQTHIRHRALIGIIVGGGILILIAVYIMFKVG